MSKRIVRKKIILNKEEVSALYSLFKQDYTLSSLSKLIPCDPITLKKCFEENGCDLDPSNIIKKVNHTFFEKIDSEEKAYLLGLFASDGCMIHKIRENKTFFGSYESKIISFIFTEADKELIEYIVKYISPTSNIYYIKERFENGYKSKPKNMVQIHSIKLFDDLLALGFSPRKTYTNFKFPVMNEDLKRHFIRGYFDGDGCITTFNNGFQFKIDSLNRDILDDIDTVLKQNGIKSGIYKTGKNSFVLQCANLEGTKKIFDLLYSNSTIFLQRKFDKFKLVKTTLTKSRTSKKVQMVQSIVDETIL